MAISAGVTGCKTERGYLVPVLVAQTHWIRPSSGLQDSWGSSTACWRVLFLAAHVSGLSIQRAPVRPSSTRWNDKRNDMLPHPT
jgi:hypothetical protein